MSNDLHNRPTDDPIPVVAVVGDVELVVPGDRAARLVGP